jgi:hydrophobic/amphiphilic exporter-1 (mainly G- bacteria), HAE1 family
MIVDASIVVLENTYRHMERGKDRMQAAIDGSEEVWSAILASTLTHVAVFVPLLFLTGVSSILFKQLAYVVMFSLSMSLFVAVTIVPVLCSRLLKLPEGAERHAAARAAAASSEPGGEAAVAASRHGFFGRLYDMSERGFDRVDETYRRILHSALQHRPTVIGAGVSAVFIAVLLLGTIPFELMPQADEGEVRVMAELPVGTRIERAQDVALRLETLVQEYVPEAETIITQAGGGGFMGGSASRTSATVRLVPRTERQRSSEQIAQAVNRQLAGVIPGVIITSRASGGNFQMNRLLGGGDEGRLSLEIRGDDLTEARRLSLAAKELMDKIPEVRNARVGREEGRPELAIQVDRPKAALFGLSVTGVANSIRTSVGGTQAAFFRQHGNEYPIVVRLREEDRERIEDINDVLISSPAGQVLQAKNLLTLRNQAGPTEIQRKNQERIVRVTGEPEGVALSDALHAVTDRLPEINVPGTFSVGFGAEAEQQATAFAQLQVMLILAIILVYAVMASQYESLRDPFIIMFSVPLAAIGVVLALKLTGTTFSLQAYIGVIMLAGIVVSNAILLVDYTNILRRRDHMPLREAVETAGRTRLRPIIMTSLTTILGLVPMSLGIGEGAELQSPLARVVIGGLAASTLITLVFVPTVYTIFEEGWKGLRKTRAI